ncbi:mitochondrial 54S ribosomal protein mL44 [Lodderomyces beijingensis]|uniref:Large ribosomal subunit protein mL44 n=1 Tax=Lodderomyces beijingensis TaxID=1775926 RepID=A0ABP0ZF08_9ASCO
MLRQAVLRPQVRPILRLSESWIGTRSFSYSSRVKQATSDSTENEPIAAALNNEYQSNIYIHRLPESTSEQSPLLVALHSRLNLSPKFQLNTLSQCLNSLPVAKNDGLANNFGLNTVGKTLLSYYVAEYLLLHYPRLPMPIHNAAVDSLMGVEALSSIGRSWGIEVDELTKLDKFLGKQSEFLKYGRLRFLDEDAKSQNIQVAGIEEVLSQQQQHLTKEDIAYAAAVRSIIGGIYTHCSEEAAKQFIQDHILSRKVPLAEMFQFSQPINELVRLCDKLQFEEPVAIRLIAETGRKSASPQFLAGVFVGNEKLGEGIGSSLKEAQTRASINSLLAYYLYSPITAEGDQISVPSDANHKFEGVVGLGDVAI